jgi:RepB DNA-primase from phage plasmid
MADSTDRGFRLTQRAVHRQLAAMPHDTYRLRLIHHQTRRPLQGERVWSARELLEEANLRFLRIRNREGFDIYLHPHAWDQNAGYILLDLDHARQGVLHRMRHNGHDPCVVVETSPGHLQAWVRVSASPLESSMATAMARRLAYLYHGDLASADWRHVGRLAGFTNQKPERRTFYGYAPWVKLVHACAILAPAGGAWIEAARSMWRFDELGRREFHAHGKSGSVHPGHASQVYQNLVRPWRVTQHFAHPDWSIVDLWVARRLLARGWPPDRVRDIIRWGSPRFPRRHGDAADYLRRTLERAAFPFPPKGGAV